MAALDYLHRAGLAVEMEGERLRVTPAERITADHRQYLSEHRAELLAELNAANDANDQPQHLIQTAATASTEWLAARDAFYHHLMPCRSCYAPTGRYCPAGAELRQRYSETSMV
ncbi:hypothetical protein SAMN05216206_3452 [Pseudomonas guineae]|uniref:TubC N-terminal docking domain-containing protein n=1 Tax=Pseudomonas guineae TaxID=425504 RepID=A0A1I3NF67_9PSED|nr:hypothetical protein [Pseudomonas guineae]SFJ07590.1 hypothetical protein SAMN05216206_3452 [Pseudomonas guineae]